ncbi:hypothetical protein Slala04_64180 [Streptomyces lavendulae subsp. lavendulae]|nr:hypothetical protein Slala04_64180 [Streptomyces lavendulae subsp. lavendulae]
MAAARGPWPKITQRAQSLGRGALRFAEEGNSRTGVVPGGRARAHAPFRPQPSTAPAAVPAGSAALAVPGERG